MGKLHNNARVANVAGTPINPATEDTVSQLVMAVDVVINETAFDLNASAFHEVTSIADDYEFDNVEFNFSTAEEKTITITTAAGTVILNETTTDTDYGWTPDSTLAYSGGENLTVDVTQFSSPGTMDCVMRVKSGTNSLLGNPTVKITDVNDTILELDYLVESVPTTSTFHHLGHEGNVFIHTNKHAVASSADLDELIKVPASPAGREVHLRFNYIATDVPGDLCLYRNTVVSDDGNQETIHSNNDVRVKTTGVTIFEGPTITDIGTLWPCGLLAGQKNSAGSVDQLVPEYILKAGTNYLLRYTNNNNSSVDVVTAIFFFDSGAT